MKIPKLICSIFVAAISFGPVVGLRAEVRLPKVFGSHMVLQQEKTLVVWGWAQPGETVTVELASTTVQVQVNEHGEWKAELPAMKAGGPYTLVAKGSSTVEFDDVMIGEVWLCSGQSNMPELWEGEAAAQSIPNTGMVVINDIGDIKDVHPQNKQEVGRRLALWALSRTYGRDTPPFLGPVFKSMTIDGDQLRLTFDHIGSGLVSRDGEPLSWFEVIDADTGGFVKADAQIEGSTVVLSSPEVKHPVAMRFAWSMFAQPNLMNVEGLPAGGFRAGTVPKRFLGKH